MAKKTIRNIPQERAPMPAQEPEVRAHNFDEVTLGYRLDDALVESERCLNCPKPNCVPACRSTSTFPALSLRSVTRITVALMTF